MRKVDALKELASALGINGVEGNRIAEVILSLAENHDNSPKEIVLSSSTPDSTKKFKITVVDNGTISATEIVEPEPEGDE